MKKLITSILILSSFISYGQYDTIRIKTGIPLDTNSLSSRINLKVNIADTAAMLTPYLRKNQLTALPPLAYNNSTYVISADTTTAITGLATKAYVLNNAGSGGSSPWTVKSSMIPGIYYNGGRVGIGDTAKSALTVTVNNIGVLAAGVSPPVDTTSMIFINNTAAAAGAQQESPSLVLQGNGWKTNATAASQVVKYRIKVLPVQAAANPTGMMYVGYSINAAGYTDAFSFSSAGQFHASTLDATTTISAGGGVSGTSWSGNAASTNAVTNIQTTPTNGFSVTNGTASTSGVPVQYSPAYRLMGTAWDGSATQQADFRFFVKPVNGASPITHSTVFQAGINNAGYVDVLTIGNNGKFTFLATNTAAGTTGAQTINKTSGTVNFAAGAGTLVVTNSLVTTSSLVFCEVRTADATAYIKNVVPAAGSFTITLGANATAETSVGFFVIN